MGLGENLLGPLANKAGETLASVAERTFKGQVNEGEQSRAESPAVPVLGDIAARERALAEEWHKLRLEKLTLAQQKSAFAEEKRRYAIDRLKRDLAVGGVSFSLGIVAALLIRSRG